MEPYVSPELTRMIRVRQGSLRDALLELEAAQTGGDRIRSLSGSALEIFRSYQLLVDALLEAVEPDQPTPRGAGAETDWNASAAASNGRDRERD